MAKYRITLIEGDGIGHEVVPAARRVLEAVGLDAEYVEAQAGYEHFLESGTSVPDATIEAVQSSDATLFGAATSPNEKVPGFSGAIRYMRRKFNLYANVRPTKTRPVPDAYQNVDLIIVRENTQGLYVEQERRYGDTAIADTVITKEASDRIGKFAADLAARRDRRKLAVIHKANVLPVTQGLFLNSVLDQARGVSGLDTSTMIVDNAAMQLVRNPGQFDVMVMTNMFGDILSDLAAGLVGGLGIAASGNIGDSFGIFESVHGSAPDIAGKGVANPTATVLASVLMLDHLGAHAEAARIDAAVNAVLEEGPRTRDLGGTAGTQEFTDALIQRLK